MEKIYLPLSGISTYQYCPYRFYLVYVCGEWQDNSHTTKGSLDHETVHSQLSRYREEYQQTTDVYIKSKKHHIVGKADIVEEKGDEIYPVEFKKGKTTEWVNNKLQLCAQTLCLEDQINTNIKIGYLWFLDSYTRKEVEFTKTLRQKTINVINQALSVMKERKLTNLAPEHRCEGCSLREICLPEEVKIINNQSQE